MLQVDFDAVITAEDVGSYKPSQRNFDYMLDILPSLGVRKEETLHIADSIFHDHEPAARLGIKSCWITVGSSNGASVPPCARSMSHRSSYKFTSMAQLVKAHHEELSKG